MINASIVLYQHSVPEIIPLVECLLKSKSISEVYLIDNSPSENKEFSSIGADYLFNSKNIGYGAAHNIALRQTLQAKMPYHLVVNPDIAFDTEILSKIENYMNDNKDIGLLMPKILYPSGDTQYLCKLVPTPFDLIFRRFLPQKWTHRRTEKFELRSTGYNHTMDVPYLSGCFMFLRTEALRQVGIFDERFFMYPEDIDLSRRIHRKFRTIFYPEVQVIHHHAQSSYLNYRMLWIHITNMIKYFNKWGWIFDKERKQINKTIAKT